MAYSITKQTLEPQAVLVQRRRVSQGPEIAKAIGEALGAIFAHAQQNGIALAGQPFTRYPEVGPGMMTIEPGMRVSSGETGPPAPGGEVGEIRADELPGGSVATTLHRGPYDQLHQAYAALEQWMEGEGVRPAAAPWEVYVTDPAEVADPEEWETEVFWPVA
jgi:AraC family transcriptional regulator